MINFNSSETILHLTVLGLAESGVRNSCLRPPLHLSLSILSLCHFFLPWNHHIPDPHLGKHYCNFPSSKITLSLFIFEGLFLLKAYQQSCLQVIPEGRLNCGSGGRGEYPRDSATRQLQSWTKVLWKRSLLQPLRAWKWTPSGWDNLKAANLAQPTLFFLDPSASSFLWCRFFSFWDHNQWRLLGIFFASFLVLSAAGCLLVGWWTQTSPNCPLADTQLTDCCVLSFYFSCKQN